MAQALLPSTARLPRSLTSGVVSPVSVSTQCSSSRASSQWAASVLRGWDDAPRACASSQEWASRMMAGAVAGEVANIALVESTSSNNQLN